MSKCTNVTLEHSCQIRAAYQLAGIKGQRLLQMFPQYCKAAIYKHAKKPINGEPHFDKRKLNKGRPPKTSCQDSRSVVRTVHNLRRLEGSFTSWRIQVESGVTNVCNRTVRRLLNKSGYYYLQSRKKGLLFKSDLKKRLSFCRNIRTLKVGQEFWNEGISFYLNGKGFEYKMNPMDQARAPATREWRLKGEGLKFGCVAKGKKEGSKKANFMIAISHGKGVVLCKQYFGAITGQKFADIVEKEFPVAFKNSSNPHSKEFLMDGCPRQNSKVARNAITKTGAKIFPIPPRSPDLNPIENFFNLTQKKLREEAVVKKIRKETFEEFSQRVIDSVMNYPAKEIDAIIESMDRRVSLVIKAKGQRIKY